MSKNDNLTAMQLYKQIRNSTGSQRNYLTRLLMKKNDSRGFVKKLLFDENQKLVLSTLKLMGEANLKENLSVLLNLMETGNYNLNKTLIPKIGKVNDQKVFDALVRQAKLYQDDDLLLNLIISAMSSGSSENEPDAFGEIYYKSEKNAKIAVLGALGRLVNRNSNSILLHALADDSPEIRYWALKAIRSNLLFVDYGKILEFINAEKNIANRGLALQLLGKFYNNDVIDFLFKEAIENDQHFFQYDIRKAFQQFDKDKLIDILNNKVNITSDVGLKKKLLNLGLWMNENMVKSTNGKISLLNRWTEIPLTDTSSTYITFGNDSQCIYEEVSRGETELAIRINFYHDDQMINFQPDKGKHASSKYIITKSLIDHPYEGTIACFLLSFEKKEINIEGINITGTEYCFIIE